MTRKATRFDDHLEANTNGNWIRVDDLPKDIAATFVEPFVAREFPPTKHGQDEEE